MPAAFNNTGQIVGGGSLATREGNPIGFLLSSGSFTTIDFPGAYWTDAFRINDAGQVVGNYGACCGAPHHAFVLSGGSFVNIDRPGAFETEAYGINNSGQLVGTYTDASGVAHGFLLSGGTFTTIDFPGAAGTAARAINDTGQIVGLYSTGGPARGFLYSGGSFTTIDFPGASSTLPYSINNAGQVVGEYVVSGTHHGFLLSEGNFSTIDVPAAPETYIYGINDAGQIVGSYGIGGVYHGFLATPAAIEVSIDIKPGSFPNSINPKSKGVIPVAILTTDTFDATTVDPTTVRFGATGTEAAPVKAALRKRDVDKDGDTDMMLHFKTQATGIVCGDTFASLTGETLSGQAIEGSDSIKTVGCK